MAAITQIRYRHSDGRACYDRKTAEGKTGKEALRSLKRRMTPPHGRAPPPGPPRTSQLQGNPARSLDNNSKEVSIWSVY